MYKIHRFKYCLIDSSQSRLARCKTRSKNLAVIFNFAIGQSSRIFEINLSFYVEIYHFALKFIIFGKFSILSDLQIANFEYLKSSLIFFSLLLIAAYDFEKKFLKFWNQLTSDQNFQILEYDSRIFTDLGVKNFYRIFRLFKRLFPWKCLFDIISMFQIFLQNPIFLYI